MSGEKTCCAKNFVNINVIEIEHTHPVDPDAEFTNATISKLWVQDWLHVEGSVSIVGPTTMADATISKIALNDGSAAEPSLTFVSDDDTGVFLQGAGQLGFTAEGALNGAISSRGISAKQGGVATPSINFGIALDVDTGLYQASSDEIGFSCGGSNAATLSGGVGGGLKVVGEIEAGLPAGGVGLIKRVSATPANSWEDGNCGNASQLVFLPSDFTDYDIRTSTTAITGWGVSEGNARPHWFGGSMGAAAGSNGARIIATKLMPKGFQIPEATAISITVGQPATGSWTLAPDWAGNGINGSTTYAMFILWTQDISSQANTAVQVVGNPASASTPLGGTINIGTNGSGVWDPTPGTCTIDGPASPSATGNGTIMVIAEIVIPSLVQITNADALAGIIVPLERV